MKVAGDRTELVYKVNPHGNSTDKVNGGSGFYPLKKSTMNRIQDELSKSRGKKRISAVFQNSQDKGGRDFGDQPRSKKQVKDLAHKRVGSIESAFNEVDTLLGYNEELEEDGIVWFHGDIPNDLWVLGTKRMAVDLSHASGGLPISIDPTFNHGAFEVTPITYRHQLIESRSKNVGGNWTNAVMVGPTIIHHSKSADEYEAGLRPIAKATGLGDQEVGIVTDGEQAIITSSKAVFKKNTPLRCTNHFHENCVKALSTIGVRDPAKQAPLLDVIFGKQGLVEADNKKHLKEMLKDACPVLDEMERDVLGKSNDYAPRFSEYVRERSKTVLRKMIRDQRRKGGLPLDQEGIPKRSYTNQSECVNSLLASSKSSLGYSKKDDLSKLAFVKDVWESTVSTQSSNVERALYGQSDQYRLTHEAKYLQVEIEVWYNWTTSQQKQ